MSFLVSPGVEVKEFDLTNVVPAVSTTVGGYAGHFEWGPADEVVNVSNEKELASRYGAPSKSTAASFFTAASFLKYGRALNISRAIESGALNASSDAAALIKNLEHYNSGTFTDNVYAKYPGVYGNSLKVAVQAGGINPRLSITGIEVVADEVIVTVDDPVGLIGNGDEITIRNIRTFGDLAIKLVTTTFTVHSFVSASDSDEVEITLGLGGVAFDASGYTNTTITTSSNSFLYANADAELFENAFGFKPGTSAYAASHGAANDEIHVLVIDEDGLFTGTPGTILEKWGNLSVATDAKGESGASIYYKNVINTGSNYILIDNLSGVISGADTSIIDGNTTFSATNVVTGWSLDGGSLGDQDTAVDGAYEALELFNDPETLDINLIFAISDLDGETVIANKLIQIADSRKDCVAFISPDIEVKDQANDQAKLAKVLTKFDKLPSTSYAVFDSSPLYVYNKYNDEFIWIPASGSVAGLCARTDVLRDAWWSPAGYNRGQLLGVTKLAYNPTQNHRDELYKARVNPLVTFPGEGTILYGDKTAQAKPSAFDRINVRRLFIVLEKAISTSAKYSLFEFNDEYTRAQFRNLVIPYLRDIQGRRGITDFRVVCDETNNTEEVIDSNRFVADIYIKPARAINFITLNVIATRTNVNFSEIVD